jgi:hypothetical protein
MKAIITTIAGSRYPILLATALLLLSILFSTGGDHTYASTPTNTVSNEHIYIVQSTPTTTVNILSPFIGTWYNHSGVLKIAADGSATFDRRVYRWCGPGVPTPCDTMKGNLIIDGIHMQIQFTHTKDSSAYGHIIKTTTQDRNYAVVLTLHHNHTASFTEDSHGPLHLNELLCDLQAQPGTCGA